LTRGWEKKLESGDVVSLSLVRGEHEVSLLRGVEIDTIIEKTFKLWKMIDKRG
jgi:hypothetical protein